MGCFLGCFKGSKDRKRRRSPKRSPSRDHRVSERYRQPIPSVKQISPNLSAPKLPPPVEEVAVAIDLPEPKQNVEQGNASSAKKKVTFDLNIRTYEQAPSDDNTDSASEDDREVEQIDEEERPAKGQKDESYPKSGAFPSNHRYENCESSDDDHGSEFGEDEDEFDSEDFDEEEEEYGIQGNEEESYDSFFSLPIDKEPQGLQEEVSSTKPCSASSPLLEKQPVPAAGGSTRDRSQFVHPVLIPVENLSQWKEIKARAVPATNPNKQHLCDEQENKPTLIAEPEIKVKKPRVPTFPTKQEVSVDASLSNWLPSSDNSTVETPQPSNSHLSNSSFSREDRPILGALTIEDIKLSSMTSSPRRSPSRSPPAEEIPIVGTVGRYWNCENQGGDSASSRPSTRLAKGIPNTTNKYREDKAVNWHTTPFEVRLERALQNGAA
ncbi:proline-, glutamic acid- and leucine-rich protein 1-like [Zingiber officinale]|uniref:proline-, glutamic acid- and leucine-rich protein 1-like n=1 Tax=Zingiber officinale TaxID=94328 RepID=UPI001C4AA2EF|nr:proline-, glutamic acid- and leucine-rich protein 1-like [Zingiber officinale]